MIDDLRGLLVLSLGTLGLLLSGCDGGTPTEAETSLIVPLITMVSGDSQFGRTGEVLTEPVVVRASDTGGAPIVAATVTFAISSGGGSLSHDSVASDRHGLARTYWTLGDGPGHSLEVSLADPRMDGDPIDITATNELALEIEVVSGANQVALSGEALPEPVIVRLTSCYGDVLAGIDLGFEVIRGGGSVAETTGTSSEAGTADFSWSLGKGPDNRVQVTVLDDSFTAVPEQVGARTELELTFAWISDILFRDDFGRIVDHDNRVLESDNFLIFSDADSDSAKITMAKHTERYFAELLQDFEITAVGEIGIDPADRRTKITVYSMREFLEQGQIAFPFGFFHAGFDSDPYLNWGIHNQRFFNSIKHETTHVLNFLATVENLNGQHWWFTEGIAEYASGGGEPRIETWAGVEEWMSGEHHINPIAIRSFPRDLPAPDADWGEYYPMFHLAVEYLLTENGWGSTFVDVKNMWADMADGVAFDSAFHTHIGITADAFERSFYSRIEDYLTRMR